MITGRFMCYAIAAILPLASGIESALAADPCVSGLDVGKRPGPYSFLVATGPLKGQLTCYVCETAEKPGLIVFARTLSNPLARLVAACDDNVVSRPKDTMQAWLTMLGEKTVGVEELSKWAKQAGLKTMPVGVFDDPVGPPSYRLSEEADITVLLFIDRKVVANFAFRKGELDDKSIAKIANEVKQLGSKK